MCKLAFYEKKENVAEISLKPRGYNNWGCEAISRAEKRLDYHKRLRAHVWKP